MEVIDPKGTPEAPKDETVKFKSEISAEGVMVVTVDLKAAIADEDNRHIMHSFMLEQVNRALGIVMSERARLNAEKQKLILAQNKNGHQGFLNKIMRRK